MKFRIDPAPLPQAFEPMKVTMTLETMLDLEIMVSSLGHLTNGVGYELHDALKREFESRKSRGVR